jgi:hypothetical protein
MHQVRFQFEGSCGPEVQGHHAHDEPAAGRRAASSTSRTGHAAPARSRSTQARHERHHDRRCGPTPPPPRRTPTRSSGARCGCTRACTSAAHGRRTRPGLWRSSRCSASRVRRSSRCSASRVRRSPRCSASRVRRFPRCCSRIRRSAPGSTVRSGSASSRTLRCTTGRHAAALRWPASGRPRRRQSACRHVRGRSPWCRVPASGRPGAGSGFRRPGRARARSFRSSTSRGWSDGRAGFR